MGTPLASATRSAPRASRQDSQASAGSRRGAPTPVAVPYMSWIRRATSRAWAAGTRKGGRARVRSMPTSWGGGDEEGRAGQGEVDAHVVRERPEGRDLAGGFAGRDRRQRSRQVGGGRGAGVGVGGEQVVEGGLAGLGLPGEGGRRPGDQGFD